MALVDYASSDEESEKECEEVEKKKTHESKQNKLNVNFSDNVNDKHEELFSSLPKPRKTFCLEDDNKLSKILLNKNKLFSNKKESVKISVPSISEFVDVTEQPASKKIKPSIKGTGLFSILPPPKNTTAKKTESNFVPSLVSKNQTIKSLNNAEKIKKYLKKPLSKETDEDEDDDASIGSSFFGSSLVQQKPDSKSDHINCENTTVDAAINVAPPGNSVNNELPVPAHNTNPGSVLNFEESDQNCSANSSQVGETVTANNHPLDLDEKALQILCGNRKKRQQMPVNIIELSGKEVLPDSKEWLLKQFTEEKTVRTHSHKKTHGPSSQSRRKHQITYLAYQAKEQELELQNQWAANRMSRKQTQSKYGF